MHDFLETLKNSDFKPNKELAMRTLRKSPNTLMQLSSVLAGQSVDEHRRISALSFINPKFDEVLTLKSNTAGCDVSRLVEEVPESILTSMIGQPTLCKAIVDRAGS